MLFSQGAADVLGGSAGWVGAGLLGVVLAWLFGKHLPAKDAQLERLITQANDQIGAKDKQLERVLETAKTQMSAKDAQLDMTLQHKWMAIEKMSEFHRDTIKGLASEFRVAIQSLSEHCEKSEGRIISQMEMNRDAFVVVLKSKFGTVSSGQEPEQQSDPRTKIVKA